MLCLIVALLTIFILLFIIFYTRKLYGKMIDEVFQLTDNDKKFIKILMRNGRVNKGEYSETDHDTLQKLDDAGWIIPLDDGALIRGECTNALMQVVAKENANAL